MTEYGGWVRWVRIANSFMAVLISSIGATEGVWLTVCHGTCNAEQSCLLAGELGYSFLKSICRSVLPIDIVPNRRVGHQMVHLLVRDGDCIAWVGRPHQSQSVPNIT